PASGPVSAPAAPPTAARLVPGAGAHAAAPHPWRLQSPKPRLPPRASGVAPLRLGLGAGRAPGSPARPGRAAGVRALPRRRALHGGRPRRAAPARALPLRRHGHRSSCVAARIPARPLRLPHQPPRALPAPSRLPPLRLPRAGALHGAEPHSPRGARGPSPSGAPPTCSSLCARRVSVMGPLTVSTWVRLDAFFAGLALLLLLYPRWVPQRPGV